MFHADYQQEGCSRCGQNYAKCSYEHKQRQYIYIYNWYSKWSFLRCLYLLRYFKICFLDLLPFGENEIWFMNTAVYHSMRVLLHLPSFSSGLMTKHVFCVIFVVGNQRKTSPWQWPNCLSWGCETVLVSFGSPMYSYSYWQCKWKSSTAQRIDYLKCKFVNILIFKTMKMCSV